MLADELVGVWQSPIVRTRDDGTFGVEFMFGKNGVLVTTLIGEGGERSQSFGSQYKIIGDQLVLMQDVESKMRRIRPEGNTLEITTNGEIGRFTRRTRDESVAVFLDRVRSDLRAPDPEPRARAVEAIVYVGPEAREAVPALLEIMKDHDSALRDNALWALINIGPEEKAILPAVIEAVNDRSDPYLAGSAAQGLGRLGARAKEAVPALIDLLKNGEESNQCSNQFHAAEALGKIGPDARAAIPALSEWAKSNSDARESVAMLAIKRIESPAAAKTGQK
jgi:hypothetical protein